MNWPESQAGGCNGGNDMSKSSLKQKAYKEIKEFYLIALYLWVVFSLFILYKSVILAEEHISFAFHGFALINALALAKVVLVARHFHLGEGFDDAPLIYPTIFKSALFTILLACFKILEDVAVGHFHGKSFQESISDLEALLGLDTAQFTRFVVRPTSLCHHLSVWTSQP